MAHYIDADRLRTELEKQLKNARDYMNGAGMRYKGPKYYKAQGKESAYDALLNVIDSLQQEQPDVDIEEQDDDKCPICGCALDAAGCCGCCGYGRR